MTSFRQDFDCQGRKGRLARWPLLHAFAALLRRTFVPSLRATYRLQKEAAGQLLQPFPDTSHDRHPALFAFARDRLRNVPAPAILCFGCSTGEEAFTLAEYIPNAQIDAVDINPRSIRIARRSAGRRGAGKITFTLAGSPPAGPQRYDAIFCLSVLRHGDLARLVPQNCAAILPFRRFAETIEALDASLLPGGILYLWGSNFRFEDTAQAGRYEAVAVPDMVPHVGPFYGPDDRLIEGGANVQFAFRKL